MAILPYLDFMKIGLLFAYGLNCDCRIHYVELIE